MTTIPASEIVNVTPSVLAAGGQAIDLNGLFLTTSTRVPIGTVQQFASPAAVAAYFGASSLEASQANVYFQGDNNSLAKPGAGLWVQYPQTAVSAYLRGASLGALTLAQLQAMTGSLTVVINGSTFTGTVNLAAATSFASAASIIAQTLGITGVVQGSVTAQQGANFTASGTGTVLTVSAVVGTGIISVGDTLAGTGIPGGTSIIAQTSGTLGGAGVYTTSGNTTASGSVTATSSVINVTAVASGLVAIGDIASGTGVASQTFVSSQISGTSGSVGTYRASSAQFYLSQAVSIQVPGVQYDTITNAFIINSNTTGSASTIAFATGSLSGSLNLTASTGAVLSQGAGTTTPAAFMAAVTQITQNWGTFVTGFTEDPGGGSSVRQAFCAWVSTTNNRYAYICKDSDVAPTTASNVPTSLGQIIIANGYSGVILVWQPSDLFHAAFVAGWAASLNFEATNGRRTLAFRYQSGLTPAVTSQLAWDNLKANGYSAIGVYGAGNENFTWIYDGHISGPFAWADSYMNQIWMNNSFQVDLLTLLQNSGTIPYNNAGATLIENGIADTVATAGAFGVFRPGVQLSQSQITQVNNAAGGKNIAPTLQTRGWYLVILPTPPAVRQVRGSPPCTFFYVDGQSVQQINLASIELQ